MAARKVDPNGPLRDLPNQLSLILEALRGGAWYTLADLALLIDSDQPASVSAGLRSLRYPCYGGYCIEKRITVIDGDKRVWEYCLYGVTGNVCDAP